MINHSCLLVNLTLIRFSRIQKFSLAFSSFGNMVQGTKISTRGGIESPELPIRCWVLFPTEPLGILINKSSSVDHFSQNYLPQEVQNWTNIFLSKERQLFCCIQPGRQDYRRIINWSFHISLSHRTFPTGSHSIICLL